MRNKTKTNTELITPTHKGLNREHSGSVVECLTLDRRATGSELRTPTHKGLNREHSGSVVECLTLDRRATGSSLTGVTVLTHLLSTGSTQEDSSRQIVDWDVKIQMKQTKQNIKLEKTVKLQLHIHDFGHGRATTHPDLSSRDASA